MAAAISYLSGDHPMNGFNLHYKLFIFLIILTGYTNSYAAPSATFFATGEKYDDEDVHMVLLTSSDAENWAPVLPLKNTRDVVKGYTGYFAAGWCRRPVTSPDGIFWKDVAKIAGDCWNNVSWANDKYFVSGGIGDADFFASLYSSVDGNNFEQVYFKKEAAPMTNVVFGNGHYIAVGEYKDGNLSSDDGKKWKHLPPYNIGALTFGPGYFVSINSEGAVGISMYGVVWQVSHILDAKINYLIWSHADKQFVAVGQGGQILTSPDAQQWTRQDSGTSERLNKITWAYGLYLAVGDNGTILTSIDGHTWKKQNSNTDFDLTGIA